MTVNGRVCRIAGIIWERQTASVVVVVAEGCEPGMWERRRGEMTVLDRNEERLAAESPGSESGAQSQGALDRIGPACRASRERMLEKDMKMSIRFT